MCLKPLCEEYVIMLPKQTESEKKHWVTAAYQTVGSRSFDHFGVIKYKIPSIEPSRVTARTSNDISTIYGKMARK